MKVIVGVIALSLACKLSAFAGGSPNLECLDPVPKGLAKSDWSSIRAAYEAGRHAFMPIEGGWQARNPGQQWTTKFDRRGFLAQPKGADWQWGLELKAYGFAGAERSISGVPAVKADGQRLSYQWDATVQEWFVNDQRGLEHGFTVAKRPSLPISHSHSLVFTLAVRGTLKPQISADAQGVLFQDASGATVLNYSGLKVWDADGKVLPSRFEMTDSQPSVRLLVEERGARYPLTIDPIAQQAYLKPSAVGSAQAGDRFGQSVAVSGDTVVVGADGEDSSSTGVNSTPNESATDAGAAYIFVRSAGVWTQQAYLKPTAVGSTQVGDGFGQSVAVSGDTVVVGASTEDSSTTGVQAGAGAPNESAANAGAAYVFVRNAGVWTQQAYLKPAAVGNTQAGDFFGNSVAVSGDTVLVGALFEDSSSTGVNSTPDELASFAGAAYVFVRNAGEWTQQAYLKPAAIGTTQAGDKFGCSVALSGDTVVVGANEEDSSTLGVQAGAGTPDDSLGASGNAGAAYIFMRSAGVWTQQAYLKPAAIGTTQAQDQFGWSVAVSGDTVVVGANFEDSSTLGLQAGAGTPNESATNAGAAYVFVRSAGLWTQQAYLKPTAVGTTQAGDQFGWSVAVAGDTVVVGAYLEASSTMGVNSTPDELAADAGAAYVFVRSAGLWTQQAYLKAATVGSTQAQDQFGMSVAVSGDTVVVGARNEDSSATGVQAGAGTPNESAANAGAAYVFTGFDPLNATPVISDIQDRTINEDANTGALSFTIGDVETAPELLTVSGRSSNQSLVPDANIVFGGSGADRTLSITPAVNQFGTATISITVSDNGYMATDTFLLTVNSVNDVPTISDITNRTISEDGNTGAIAFTIGDVETAAASLTVTRSSSNTTLVPTANIVLGGSGANRTVTVTPAANQFGTSTITLTVSDGSASANDTFLLTISAVNDAPTITDIVDQTIAVNTLTDSLPFTVGDIETAVASLTVSGTSSNQVLVADGSIFFGGSGASRTVTVIPESNQVGSTTITVTVSDGALTRADTFVVNVVAPEIAVEQPFTSNIPDGGARSFGSVAVSGNTSLTFYIRNTGTVNLNGLAITRDGTDAAMFTVTTSPASTVSGPNGNTAFTVRFAPTSAGLKTAAIHVASNDPDENPFDITLTGMGVIPITDWRQQYFGSTANSGNGADATDYDQDGLPNLIEYAFGLNPTQNSAGQLPQGQMASGNFGFSFTEPTGVTGITYGAEWSATLAANDWHAITDTGTLPQHVFSVPVGGNAKLFIRLKVTNP
jgi:hypothetical protein